MRRKDYGLIGIMRGKLPDGKTVLLRADIDALPVEEPEGLPYRSEHPGCMHACGHDAMRPGSLELPEFSQTSGTTGADVLSLCFSPGKRSEREQQH